MNPTILPPAMGKYLDMLEGKTLNNNIENKLVKMV